jgi:limonene-1,2-epoxide hydrolase
MTSADPATVVRSFLGRLEDLDVDAALAFADPAILYHNKGLPPARGIATFEKQMRALAKHATAFEARIHHLAADGPIVLTERTDAIEVRRFRSEFWVCGTFDVRDGRIVLWRDHFDFADVTIASLRGLVRAALHRRASIESGATVSHIR